MDELRHRIVEARLKAAGACLAKSAHHLALARTHLTALIGQGRGLYTNALDVTAQLEQLQMSVASCPASQVILREPILNTDLAMVAEVESSHSGD